MKKPLKVLLSVVLGIALVVVAFFSYIHLSNSEVDRQLRLSGFIVHALVDLDSEESLIAASIASMSATHELRHDSVVTTEERFIRTRDGNDLRVLIFRPTNPRPNATGLLWIHGGGYAVGSPDQEFITARRFIETANVVVVSPAYTLSGIAPFPAAFNDCFDTLVWMKENAEELGINPNQLFVGGVSAGGGLAAAVVLHARDSGLVNVAFQMPLYPMINPRMDTPSAIGNESLIWNSRRNLIAWRLYLGDLFGTNHIPTHAAVALETDFSNLPPAFTFIGDLDPFYDDIIGWVNNMRIDGVRVEFHRFRGAYHGFEVIVPNAGISRVAIEKKLAAFKYATEHFFAYQTP